MGATISIISAKMASKHKLKINKCDTQVRLTDDSIVQVIGIIDPLSIKIKGHEFTLPFLIFEHKVYDVFLGLDYVKKADLGKLQSRNALMFGNVKESIKYDSESEDEITSEKINNEELFTSSILEACWAHNSEVSGSKPRFIYYFISILFLN